MPSVVQSSDGNREIRQEKYQAKETEKRNEVCGDVYDDVGDKAQQKEPPKFASAGASRKFHILFEAGFNCSEKTHSRLNENVVRWRLHGVFFMKKILKKRPREESLFLLGKPTLNNGKLVSTV